MFIDLATNRDSNYSQADNERTQVMMQAQQKEQLKLIADTDNMEDAIKQRKKEIG